ncbi:hypothetical protein [Streptomyces sulphureus]|uniref:hypothetical protein n=1 Tax=Streptomyces sulphureus TaxID=47758 RepID=UPI0003688DB3|nr:hypothetical protein [Streptomyces sulphureus]
MARNSAGFVVAGLTAAALAGVGFLALQANAAQDRAEQGKPSPSPTRSANDREGGEQAEKPSKSEALPPRSGKGMRVVYALERKRVWLVEKGGEVERTFRVMPSPVSPPPGEYRVESRASHVTGSDNVPVENVVRFATVRGTTIGFSAALDGSTPDPESRQQTGGVRETREDGEAMWLFATIGTKVVVVR